MHAEKWKRKRQKLLTTDLLRSLAAVTLATINQSISLKYPTTTSQTNDETELEYNTWSVMEAAEAAGHPTWW